MRWMGRYPLSLSGYSCIYYVFVRGPFSCFDHYTHLEQMFYKFRWKKGRIIPLVWRVLEYSIFLFFSPSIICIQNPPNMKYLHAKCWVHSSVILLQFNLSCQISFESLCWDLYLFLGLCIATLFLIPIDPCTICFLSTDSQQGSWISVACYCTWCYWCSFC